MTWVMASTLGGAVPAPGLRPSSARLIDRLPTLLGMRLFVLAIACACGSLVPSVVASPGRFLAGMLAATILAVGQDRALRVAPRVTGALSIALHLLLWTFLVSISGG